MRKLILLATFGLIFSFAAKSQSSNTAISSLDTLVDADTSTIITTVNGAKSNLTFQVNITKISGTVAGSITVYGSIDGGTNYVQISTDTLTNTTGTKAYVYAYSINSYVKYKIVVLSSGTNHASNRVWILYR